MEPHSFDNLGAVERPVDARDRLVGSVSPFPATYMQDKAFNAPIYYQGKRPACGAHAGAWLYTYLTGKKYTPRATWIDIKKDGTSPSDGTDMRSIFKSMQKTGVEPFEPRENDVSLDDIPYASGTVSPTKEKIGAYGFNDSIGFDALKSLIYQNGAAILLMRVGKTMWTDSNGNNSWQEKDILPLKVPSEIVSGHFVVAHSYDEKNIYFANSWSTDWGRKGHGYFGADYMPLVIESGTASAQTLPPNTSVPYEQALANLQKSGLKGVVLSMAIAILKLKYGRL